MRNGLRLRLGMIAACTAIGLVPASSASAQSLRPGDAKDAARTTVARLASYKVIDSSFSLQTEACRTRTSAKAVCLLYRTAPTPCALRGTQPADSVCAQNLSSRAWLVSVRASRRGARTTVQRVEDLMTPEPCLDAELWPTSLCA